MAFKKPNIQALEKTCWEWNDLHPVGTEVDVNLDGGEIRRTTTRSEAEVLSGHSAVIWLKGISGCYLLSHVKAVSDAQ